MQFKFLLAGTLACAGLAHAAVAEEWPRVAPIIKDGRPVPPEVDCWDAQMLGRIAYFGTSFVPDIPAGKPLGLGSDLLLMPEPAGEAAAEPSGDNDVAAAQPMFSSPGARYIIADRFEQAAVDEYRAAYVYKPLVAGKRLAIGLVWFGDAPHYVSYLRPPASTAEEVLKLLETVISDTPNAPVPATHSIFPPRLYRDPVSKQPWLLQREDGATANDRFLAPWQVLTVGDDGLKARCRIEFHAPGKPLLDALPAPVRQLVRQLEATMGSGKNEGTFQQTARLRNDARYAWINIALRPWVSASPYNSRSTVDRELAIWGKRAPANQRAEAQIRKQLVVAETALADYYRRKFDLPAALARRLAAYQLDLGFRSHFVFSETAGLAEVRPAANPWPAGKNERLIYPPDQSAD